MPHDYDYDYDDDYDYDYDHDYAYDYDYETPVLLLIFRATPKNPHPSSLRLQPSGPRPQASGLKLHAS